MAVSSVRGERRSSIRFEWTEAVEQLEREGACAELLARIAATEAGPWRARAACRGRRELFFSGSVRGALAVCRRCPVLAECRAWVLALPDGVDRAGVAGGLTVSQRRLARASVPPADGIERRATTSGRDPAGSGGTVECA